MVFIALLLQLLSGLYFPSVVPAATKPLAKATPITENKESDEKLAWSGSRRLNWDDFKGLPDDNNPHHALTAANLAVDAKCRNNQFVYEVKCVFLPSESWSKNKKSDKLLEHEQLHFDLTEIHARMLRKKLKSLGATCNNLQSQLDIAVNTAFKEWKEEQKKFDELSRHGLEKEVQQQWAYNIDTRLKQLEAYQ